VRLESNIELNLNELKKPDLSRMKDIFSELEMKKSWEEAQARYRDN
jgi:hypothetical protein